MKILIIGSKGFIGKALEKASLKKGIDTYTCDVVADYVSKKYSIIDASNPEFNSIFEQEQYDICVNCSGAASVPASLNNPLRDYLLNTVNVFKILNGIRKHQKKCKFLNLSSAAIYGNPVSLPISEVMDSQPLSPYGVHKMQAETICKEFNDLFDVPTASIRIFSAYGDGLTKQLFWDLHKKAEASQEVKLFGTGQESRDFIYIQDLVNAIFCVIQKGVFNGDCINVANGREILIKDAVAIFYKHYAPSVKFTFSGEFREGDPNNWCADISLLQSLGYKEEYSFESGIIKYCQWLRK